MPPPADLERLDADVAGRAVAASTAARCCSASSQHRRRVFRAGRDRGIADLRPCRCRPRPSPPTCSACARCRLSWRPGAAMPAAPSRTSWISRTNRTGPRADRLELRWPCPAATLLAHEDVDGRRRGPRPLCSACRSTTGTGSWSVRRRSDLVDAGYVAIGKDFPVFLHPESHEEEVALARTERKTAPGYHGFAFHASNRASRSRKTCSAATSPSTRWPQDERRPPRRPLGRCSSDLQARACCATCRRPLPKTRCASCALARFAARYGDFSRRARKPRR